MVNLGRDKKNNASTHLSSARLFVCAAARAAYGLQYMYDHAHDACFGFKLGSLILGPTKVPTDMPPQSNAEALDCSEVQWDSVGSLAM